jgi:hypothetical protein
MTQGKKPQPKRNTFERGRSTFKCQCCGRMTRETGIQSMGSDSCPDCYELAGQVNALSDSDDFDRAYVLTLCANIRRKGGKVISEYAELETLANTDANFVGGES